MYFNSRQHLNSRQCNILSAIFEQQTLWYLCSKQYFLVADDISTADFTIFELQMILERQKMQYFSSMLYNISVEDDAIFQEQTIQYLKSYLRSRRQCNFRLCRRWRITASTGCTAYRKWWSPRRSRTRAQWLCASPCRTDAMCSSPQPSNPAKPEASSSESTVEATPRDSKIFVFSFFDNFSFIIIIFFLSCKVQWF